MKLVLLGPPGAGKGTQAERIAERYSLAHVSTGEMLRAEIAFKTPLGLKAKLLIDEGELVPDEVINEMVKNRIKRDDCIVGYMLDGYPRTLAQAEALASFADIDRAICINVPAELIVERMASRMVCPKCKLSYSIHGEDTHCVECGTELIFREDDKPETVRHRLAVYEELTHPLVDFYRERGILSEIDGVGSVDEVAERIFDTLDGVRE